MMSGRTSARTPPTNSVKLPSETSIGVAERARTKLCSAQCCRITFLAGVSYEVPSPRDGTVAKVILQHWALQSFVLARSATPIDVSDGNFTEFVGGVRADVRPDIIVGQSLYL